MPTKFSNVDSAAASGQAEHCEALDSFKLHQREESQSANKSFHFIVSGEGRSDTDANGSQSNDTAGYGFPVHHASLLPLILIPAK